MSDMHVKLTEILGEISSWVWGPPLLILLVGTGFFLTFRSGFIQFRLLGHSLYLALVERKEKGSAEGDITHFQALMTALAATVGTGNIAGVATAIALGGPGALFWMWVTGLVGMATKYSEALLAVKYRVVTQDGSMGGGPMYYIANGLKLKWLGVLFAAFAAIAAFGIGSMVQTNSVAHALQSTFEFPAWATGVLMAVLTGAVVIGGVKWIGRVTSFVVPFMIVAYIFGALWVVAVHAELVPSVLADVLVHAFTPTAAAGGFLGSAVMMTIRMGVARGIFSNESGLGSSPIAAAAAKTKGPVRQALVSMTQTFIDTIIVCSLTGLAILTTKAHTLLDASGNGLTGAELTSRAFSLGLPGETAGAVVVSLSLVLFAYSTMLGWCYYGEKSVEFLFGSKTIYPYRLLFILTVGLGAVLKLDLVWSFADVTNGLMAFPNLVGLLLLSGVVASETRKYLEEKKKTP